MIVQKSFCAVFLVINGFLGHKYSNVFLLVEQMCKFWVQGKLLLLLTLMLFAYFVGVTF